jgi:hypothetical protein
MEDAIRDMLLKLEDKVKLMQLKRPSGYKISLVEQNVEIYKEFMTN